MLTKKEKELIIGLINSRIIGLGQVLINSDEHSKEAKADALGNIQDLTSAKTKIEMEVDK